jgi:hypothetical protein
MEGRPVPAFMDFSQVGQAAYREFDDLFFFVCRFHKLGQTDYQSHPDRSRVFWSGTEAGDNFAHCFTPAVSRKIHSEMMTIHLWGDSIWDLPAAIVF